MADIISIYKRRLYTFQKKVKLFLVFLIFLKHRTIYNKTFKDMSVIMTMYYGQLLIGFICGAGSAFCLSYLLKNKRRNMKKNAKDRL